MRALAMMVHTITLRVCNCNTTNLPSRDLSATGGVSEGILRPALSVAVSDHAETYRRTWRRSRSGSDRWVRFTPCLHGQVSWSHGGVVVCDAGEMRSRPWAGGRVRGGDDGGRMRPEHCHCRWVDAGGCRQRLVERADENKGMRKGMADS